MLRPMADPFPTPAIIEPQGSTHTHTCILLHGLGSNGRKFGTELLASRDSSGKTLGDAFPGMKFIFPTARRSRCTLFKRAKTNQWFDVSSQDKDDNEDYLAVDGLAEVSAYIRELVADEITTYGIAEGNVVLGGISQGFAASIYTLLTMGGGGGGSSTPVGAFVGISGWLPFVRDVEMILGLRETEGDDRAEIVEGEEGGVIFGNDSQDEEDGEEQSTTDGTPLSKPVQAVNFLRENIDLGPLRGAEASAPACLRVPVFLGHGEEDEKVPIRYGEIARNALLGLGMDVKWMQYPDLGHWYKVPDQIDDIIAFLDASIRFS